jgi:hypothetical protein
MNAGENYKRALLFIRHLFIVAKTYHLYPCIVEFLVLNWKKTLETERYYMGGIEMIKQPVNPSDFVRAYSLFIIFGKRDKRGCRECLVKLLNENGEKFRRFARRKNLTELGNFGRFLINGKN